MHCGGQRFAFNWGLSRVKANLDQRAAEKSYGIPDGQLTPSVSWSAYSLRKDWNQAKDEVAPWWAENSKEAYSSGLANLAAALKNWADSRTGKRSGRKLGFPRFKGKRVGLSCRFTTGAFGLADIDRRHVKLPRDRPGAHARVDAEAGPACRARHRPHPVGDRVASAGPLVRVVHGGDHPH